MPNFAEILELIQTVGLPVALLLGCLWWMQGQLGKAECREAEHNAKAELREAAMAARLGIVEDFCRTTLVESHNKTTLVIAENTVTTRENSKVISRLTDAIEKRTGERIPLNG